MASSGGRPADEPPRNSRSVYDTGVNCEEDENLRVKEVDTVYKATAVEMAGKQPYATRSLKPASAALETGTSGGTEARVESKKGKRKKIGGPQQQLWTKKVVRTKNGGFEEQETISMYLRSADTVIDVSIKSPAKRKKTTRRQSKLSASATSTGPSIGGTHVRTGSSDTLQEMRHSGSPRKIDAGVDGVLEENAENSARTQLLDSSSKKSGTEQARRSLHKFLEAGKQPENEAAIGEGFSFPGLQRQQAGKELEPIPHTGDGAAPQQTEERGSVPVEEGTNEPIGTAGTNRAQCRVSSEEPSLNVYAKDSEPLAMVEIPDKHGKVEDRQKGVVCGGASTSREITLVNPPAASVVSNHGLTNVGTDDAGDSAILSQPTDAGNTTTAGIEFPTVDADMGSSPPSHVAEIMSQQQAPHAAVQSPNPAHEANMGSPQTAPNGENRSTSAAVATGIEFPTTEADIRSPSPEPPAKPKACQLTVADCLAEFRVRSRSPSPIPISQPQVTPSSRPPRQTKNPRNSSPPTRKLVPTMSPTKSASKGGKNIEEPKLYLDAILSKLSPAEQARYLRAKAEMLEEKLGGTGVQEGLTTSVQKGDKSKCSNKDNMRKEVTPPESPEMSKKELRRQKRAAEKKAEMESIDKAMRDLEIKKALLEAECKRKSTGEVPSPRESSKGQHSKRSQHTKEASKGLKVSQIPAGRLNSHSIESSALSLPSESNVISDVHSIGLWDAVTDVPPCEVNALGQPIGRFWKHMQSYTHGRAPWIFPWDVSWPNQDKALKRAFASRVQSLYPGKYDIDYVLEDVATNIRQRRQRTRNHMKKHNSKKYTPIAHGLTVKAWNNIWASISNRSYQDKSNKCKAAADARTERMGYTHRLGSLGVAGLIKKFEEEFKRVPTEDEVAIGKRDGIRSLFEMTNKRYNTKVGEPDRVLAIKQAGASKSAKKKPRSRTSADTDEESARTSSDDEEEGEASKEAKSSRSGSSKSGSSEEEGQEDVEEAETELKENESEDDDGTQKEQVGTSSEEESADERD